MDIFKSIELDFNRSKYVSVNAKQYDKTGRSIRITCMNDGTKVRIDKNTTYAFIRYRRADGKGLLRSCKIEDDGTVCLSLQGEMLEVSGKCYADIILIEGNTPREPLAENGFFVCQQNYDEDLRRLEIIFTPNVNTQYEDGVLKIQQLDSDGKQVQICDNPSPFVYANQDRQLVFAEINETGDISIDASSVLSTMPFCVNVVESSFYGKCDGIMQ